MFIIFQCDIKRVTLNLDTLSLSFLYHNCCLYSHNPRASTAPTKRSIFLSHLQFAMASFLIDHVHLHHKVRETIGKVLSSTCSASRHKKRIGSLGVKISTRPREGVNSAACIRVLSNFVRFVVLTWKKPGLFLLLF